MGEEGRLCSVRYHRTDAGYQGPTSQPGRLNGSCKLPACGAWRVAPLIRRPVIFVPRQTRIPEQP